MQRTVVSVATLALVITATSAAAGGATAPRVPVVMVVSKSSNRNEVHYGVNVDAACAPVTAAPVYAYWQMRERGPAATEALSRREVAVLGVGTQEVSQDSVQFVVRGMQGRTFVAHLVARADGTCGSWVETTIAGRRARVSTIWVKEKLFGVDYVLLRGRAPDGKIVDERLHP